MLQTRTARWVALTAFACVGVLAAAWFLLVSPRRAEAAEIRDQTATAAAQNDALELKVAQLRAQFATLATDKAELAKILQQLPPGAGTAPLVRSLDQMATASGVVLKSVTPGAATYVPQTVAGQTAAGQTAAGQAASGQAAAGQAASGQSASGQAAGAASTTKVVSIPLIVVVHGDYFQTVVFLKKLQTEMPRAFLVSSLQVAKAGSGAGAAGVDLTIGGKVFALLGMDTGSASGAAAGSASGSGAPAPGTSTTVTGTTNALGATTPRAGSAANRPVEDS